MNNKDQKLVTVVVLTYNSERTISETLDSIYSQTYHNIQLVIADDCSKDDTVHIIKEWVENNRSRFHSVKIILNESNIGVTNNSNLAVNNSEGEWIALFAGDDLMLPNYISYNAKKVIDEPENKMFQSMQYVINETGGIIATSAIEHLKMREVIKMPVEDQYQYLLFDDIKLSPSMFFEKKAFESIGGCDSQIRNIEDYPLKLRFLKNGYRIGFVDEYLVKYRVHDSISHRMDSIYSIDHLEQRKKLKKSYCYPYICKRKLRYWLSEYIDAFQIWGVINLFGNKNSLGTKAFRKVVSILNPRKWHYIYLQIKYRKYKED